MKHFHGTPIGGTRHDLDEQVTRLRRENKSLREALRELWRTQDPEEWDATFAQEVSDLCKD